MKRWARAERAARHVAYIAFFALLLGAMERFGTSAKAFVAGVSVGLTLGSVGVLLFLVKSVDTEEEKESQSKDS